MGCCGRIKDNYPHKEPGSTEGVSSVGVFLRHPNTYLSKFWRKNSERLGRQVRLEFEPDISRLPALRAEPISHWSDILIIADHKILIRKYYQ